MLTPAGRYEGGVRASKGGFDLFVKKLITVPKPWLSDHGGGWRLVVAEVIRVVHEGLRHRHRLCVGGARADGKGKRCKWSKAQRGMGVGVGVGEG